MILAQIQAVDPIHLWNFVLIVTCLISAAASVVAMYTQKRTQKREVTFGEEFVALKHCTDRHTETDRRLTNVDRDVERIRQDMKNDRISLDASDELRASRIHQSIDTIRKELELKIDLMPDRVIVMLKNTGVIK